MLPLLVGSLELEQNLWSQNTGFSSFLNSCWTVIDSFGGIQPWAEASDCLIWKKNAEYKYMSSATRVPSCSDFKNGSSQVQGQLIVHDGASHHPYARKCNRWLLRP
ncbi:uncharacterized protein PHALS_14926 [Plasmopara halstedii]|uniref:Uncharacterized protein n=1 Tax=Plasmopara halstedii TaxID=4781 RepID=A0A0N7L3S5_PLAHL|nr:uncharacterized protein PHALS_14926 [Plasmopara halstedii]CEG36691.1 hypothetical protein PHALS_14926 [Plasmopara halstedii]|eukprot:XP_024573060.1 hypothetical protein PHALS_14926 [Plasmopara halstedii]